MAGRLNLLDCLSSVIGAVLGCRPKWPTAGRGSLQLSIVHGLGDTFGVLYFTASGVRGLMGSFVRLARLS